MSGYVVVLATKEPGVTSFPTMPGLERLMRQQAEAYQRNTGKGIESPPKYFEGGGNVLSFTIDRGRARVFPSRAAAQAAIDRIPEHIRPGGLSVEPVE